MTREHHRDQAVSLLQHYLRLIAEAAGIEWVDDMDSETEHIVDHIIESSKQTGGDTEQ